MAPGYQIAQPLRRIRTICPVLRAACPSRGGVPQTRDDERKTKDLRRQVEPARPFRTDYFGQALVGDVAGGEPGDAHPHITGKSEGADCPLTRPGWIALLGLQDAIRRAPTFRQAAHPNSPTAAKAPQVSGSGTTVIWYKGNAETPPVAVKRPGPFWKLLRK